MIYAWITASIAALDLCLKEAVEKQDDKDFPRELRGSRGMVILYKNHNPGFSFGALKEYPEVVKAIPLAVTSALAGAFVWLLPRGGQMAAKIGLAVTLGGAISNLFDRLFRGYVVDYFSVQWKGLKKVVLNLGDICIFIGTAILLLNEFTDSIRKK